MPLNTVNSNATIKPLKITGNNDAINKFLLLQIKNKDIIVAKVPNKISNELGLIRLLIKQPRVKEVKYFLLKKHKSTKTSEILNWIGPYDRLPNSHVNTTYMAATLAYITISLMLIFFI